MGARFDIHCNVRLYDLNFDDKYQDGSLDPLSWEEMVPYNKHKGEEMRKKFDFNKWFEDYMALRGPKDINQFTNNGSDSE